MLRGLVALLLVCATQAQDEEPFKLPSLKGNAFFADPFANTDSLGSIWEVSSSAKGNFNSLILLLSRLTIMPFVLDDNDNNLDDRAVTNTSVLGDGSQFDGRWAIESASANPEDLGLVVKDKAKHHAISAKLNKKVDFSELHEEQRQFVVQVKIKFLK